METGIHQTHPRLKYQHCIKCLKSRNSNEKDWQLHLEKVPNRSIGSKPDLGRHSGARRLVPWKKETSFLTKLKGQRRTGPSNILRPVRILWDAQSLLTRFSCDCSHFVISFQQLCSWPSYIFLSNIYTEDLCFFTNKEALHPPVSNIDTNDGYPRNTWCVNIQ